MIKKLLPSVFLLTTIPLLSGCFHKPIDKRDPYENFNRPMFAFNMTMDHLFLRPVTHVYDFVTPKFVQKGVTNAFDNFDEFTSIPNDALQGKFLFMLNDFWRVVINSTVGIGGLFDVAKHMGLRPHYESFGLTLAYWQGGKHYSPYLVLPLIGPGTFRSAYGEIVDIPTSPLFYIPNKYWYADLGLRFLNIVNRRSALMEANRMIDTAFDPYVFVRSAYTQTMDRIVKENQNETFESKDIVSQNVIRVSDFEAAEGAAGEVSGAGENKGGESKGISRKHAEDSGFIFDDTGTSHEPAKKDDKAKTEGTSNTTSETTTEKAQNTAHSEKAVSKVVKTQPARTKPQ
jgi:phospholipid-binding lipoprotein MlaA